MMYYPLQPVYLVDDEAIGIYVGYKIDPKFPLIPDLWVYRLQGKDGKDSDTFLYQMSEIIPISETDSKSATKTKSMMIPGLTKDSVYKMPTEKDLEKIQHDLLNFMLKLYNSKTIQKKYKLEPLEETPENNDK